MTKLLNRLFVPLILLLIWSVLFFNQSEPFNVAGDFGGFFILGVIGAIFANATGAGGGVVFVPVFNHLGFAPVDIVATSFAIQCCGMTAGAFSWWGHFRRNEKHNQHWAALPQLLMLCVPGAICGILMAQYAGDSVPLLSVIQGNVDDLHLGFGIFSVFLALVIFASIPLLRKTTFKSEITSAEILVLPMVAFLGGAITAWLSVGVGELVAVLLILRGFSVTLSIAVAVILSAVTVWSGVFYHLFETQAVAWPVVLFAGAGAIIGGRVARYVVLAFSVQKLKLFFGFWVLLLGLSGLPAFNIG